MCCWSRFHSSPYLAGCIPISQCWEHPWLCFDELLLCLCFSPSVDVISQFLFPVWKKSRMILLLPGWGWGWTRRVSQFSTESSRRNKLKGVGKRIGGENQRVPHFFLSRVCSPICLHLRGEFLSTWRRDCEGHGGEEETNKPTQQPQNQLCHPCICSLQGNWLPALAESMENRKEQLPSSPSHICGKRW